MNYKFGTRSKERMKGVNDVLIECATRALAISKHDMTIPGTGGLRTPEQQNELFQKGYSQMDGYTKRSYHQSGFALDVIPVKDGYKNDKAFRHFAKCIYYSWQLMAKNGKIPTNYYLEWGGHWQNFIDVPHWQIILR